MAGMFGHSYITAGGISKIDIKEGIFPGGDFIYRFNQRYVLALAAAKLVLCFLCLFGAKTNLTAI